MHILVTGSDGYIGSILTALIHARGDTVIGLDTGYYRQGLLFNTTLPLPFTLTKDIRHITIDDLYGIDAVVHLAELSNDPLGQQDPEITFKINHQGSVHLAEMAKRAGVERFIYTSSCSVYGAGGGEFKTEESTPNPQTAYAECKVLVERDVGALNSPAFTPVFLRNATAFGASPRMRFDIVLNNLAGFAWTTKEIRVMSDGTPWRPLVHINDICQAIIACIDAPSENIRNEIFNVGADNMNYRVREIADIVASKFPGCTTTIGSSGGDNRSYRVSFAKIGQHLPSFKCEWDAGSGAAQLYRLFARIGMPAEVFEAPPFTRLMQLRHLIATKQLDRELFWTPVEV